MDYKKSLKCFGIVAIAGSVSLNSTFGNPVNMGLFRFLNRELLEEKLNKDAYIKEYLKDQKQVWQDYLKDDYKEILNTHLYILISSYRQARTYGTKVVRSMEANAKNLAILGVTTHIIVRCDGENENGQDVISGDLRAYAEILNQEKIAFRIHESERVNLLDFAYEYHQPDTAHWELVANEKNLECSGTRHASIDMIEKEVTALRTQGKNVYIGIFDGDDWVHEDFYPVLLLNAFYSKRPVSNYNGRMGAHGLENAIISEKRMLDFDVFKKRPLLAKWMLYMDMQKDDITETFSKDYAEKHPERDGHCCTTKIFEADYFYQKLNSLWEEKRKFNSEAERNEIELKYLICLDGFKNGCTCTTPYNGEPKDSGKEDSLFCYTK